MLEDKLYTIKEIAKMTNLTDRTIRNYLVNGSLKGIKVGGQWRFSKDDIKKFFNDSKFEHDIKNKLEKDMIDFYHQTGVTGACIVIKKVVKDVKALMNGLHPLKEYKEKGNMTVTVIDNDGNTTITIFGNFDYIAKVLEVVQGIS